MPKIPHLDSTIEFVEIDFHTCNCGNKFPQLRIVELLNVPNSTMGVCAVEASKTQFFFSNMLKSTTPSSKKVGSGCYVIQGHKGENSAEGKSKPVPNNQGKKYFSWGMKERNMLLRECAHA